MNHAAREVRKWRCLPGSGQPLRFIPRGLFSLGVTAILLCLVSLKVAALPNPQERIDYWQRNYTELTEQDDKRVPTAHSIFTRVLKVAGTRYGVTPRLFIIKENPFNVVLPISIPDGWIILSRQVLDLCYQHPEQGDDRLAFILSHEIAHLLDDDFWHMNFFSALSLLQQKQDVASSTVHEIEGIFSENAKVQAKELRADERGILFATMAGYNPYAIVGRSGQPQDNFFYHWHNLLDVTAFKGAHPARRGANQSAASGETHPTLNQRSTAVLARLQQVSEQSDLFRLGLMFYQSGKFELAASAFAEFLRYFPGREVYHNLAVAHHQVALKYYRQKPELAQRHLLPFRLPVTADPYTRAAFGVSRGQPQDEREKFTRHINLAIKYYQTAIAQDSGYALAYQNMASAYLLNDEPYKAVATLQESIAHFPDNPTLLNALGVGLYLAGNIKKSRDYLRQAMDIAPNFSALYYNLGKIDYLQGHKTQALALWQRFVELDPYSPWASHLAANFNVHIPDNAAPAQSTVLASKMEQLVGVQVGNYLDELPGDWGQPQSKSLVIGDSQYRLLDYNNGVSVVTQGDEVIIVAANRHFSGKTRQGINIGSRHKRVLSRYGAPELALESAQGRNLLYPHDGISFQLAGDEVVSWSIY